MKTLIIINEPFEKMVIGKNTSLSYILAAFDLGHEVYITNLPESGNLSAKNINSRILAIKLGKQEGNILFKNYKKTNKVIVSYAASKDYAGLRTMPIVEVGDLIKTPELETLELKDVGLVLQRSEPMKAPFPPEGTKKVDDILQEIRNIFPANLIFNCPIGLCDKEVTQEINRILAADKKDLISIPTEEIKINDDSFSNAINAAQSEYEKLYQSNKSKVVLKPKNSAQTLGVFAISFEEKGLDEKSIISETISELAESQIYHIKNDLDEKSLKEVITILCFIQRVKNNKALFSSLEKKQISELKIDEISQGARELYNEEILVQPFLEGVKSGDVRVNYFKNDKGEFYLAGSVFRSSLQKESGENFTTAYVTGSALSKPISSLFLAEEKDILEKSEVLLKIINQNLKEKYQNVTEFGADFILVGDNKTSLLSEINHHCQGLVPVAEAMEKAFDLNADYDGGLFLAKKFVKDILELQERKD